MDCRLADFKLGCWHGKLSTGPTERETKIQRHIFAVGSVRIFESSHVKRDIRIFGYEVPLGPGKGRVHSADLLGYDKNWDLYVIELKNNTNQEELSNAIEEVNRYENYLKISKGLVAREFREMLFLADRDFPGFNRLVKVIAAPKSFYEGKPNLKRDIAAARDCSIKLCYIPDKTFKFLAGEMKSISGEPVRFSMYSK